MFAFNLLRKCATTPGLKTLAVVLSLISMFLIVFLALACHRPSHSFSDIYLIETASDKGRHIIRAGYFKMCEITVKSNGTTIPFKNSTASAVQCRKLGHFHDKDVAYMFSRHVIRPYFVVITAIFTAVTFFVSLANAVIPFNKAIYQLALLISAITLAFAIVTACWQQVAVHAAATLVSDSVKRGRRAAGLVWSAVALLILTIVCQAMTVNSQRKNNNDDYPSSVTTEASYISDAALGKLPQ